MVDSGHLVALGALVHWLIWFGTGWVTMRLWKILFPSRQELALPAACLAAAPLVFRLQFVLLNPTLTAMAGPLFTWMVLLPLLAPADDDERASRCVALHVAMVIVVAAATMISEYVLPTVIAGAILLIGLGPRREGKPKQIWITIGLLLFTAVAAYAVYRRVGSSQFRREVDPASQDWSWRIFVVGPRLITATWKVTMGELLQRIGELDFSSGREMLVGLFAGLAATVAVGWICRRHVAESAGEHIVRGNLRVFLTLAAALVAGMLPVVAMGARFSTWSGSRFFGSLLPLESCMGVALVSLLVGRRFWTVLPAAFGFLSGYYIVSDGLLTVHERQYVVQLGDRLESYVPDDGMTVAFVSYPWRRSPDGAELNPRLTLNWPAAKRKHFFAYAGEGPVLSDPNEASPNMRISVLLDPFGSNPRLFRPATSIGATGAGRGRFESSPSGSQISKDEGVGVTQLLWVRGEPSGNLHVESVYPPKNRSP
jgi:hypothetical protein